jgi:flagellar biosynthesis/type III secretory pathway M-ring protein FliF/YscJ
VAYLLVLIVLAGVVYLISAPLRAARRPDDAGSEAVDVAELEAARDAKYREIRDAELDVRTGKLSDEDYAALDGSLRAEAVQILHQLDEARADEQVASRS